MTKKNLIIFVFGAIFMKLQAQTTNSTDTLKSKELNQLNIGDTIQLDRKVVVKDATDMKWIEPDDNPFKIKVFNCRNFAINRISMSGDAEIVKSFALLRQSNGKENIGKSPNNGLKVDVNLNFNTKSVPNFENGIPDGVLFKAKIMEEKWDIYKYSNLIYFIRSWTGELVYVSNYIETETGFRVDSIILDNKKFEDINLNFECRVVEFLIKNHILNLTVPHPIPKTVENDPLKIAAYSFSVFGNRGFYATYD
jgi:hypothetical protein